MTVKKEISFIPPDYRQQEKWQLRIITDRCKGCLFCIEYCPSQILESSPEYNAKGYHPPKLKDGLTMDDCAKCGFCELICPEFSIYLENQTTPDEKPTKVIKTK